VGADIAGEDSDLRRSGGSLESRFPNLLLTLIPDAATSHPPAQINTPNGRVRFAVNRQRSTAAPIAPERQPHAPMGTDHPRFKRQNFCQRRTSGQAQNHPDGQILRRGTGTRLETFQTWRGTQRMVATSTSSYYGDIHVATPEIWSTVANTISVASTALPFQNINAAGFQPSRIKLQQLLSLTMEEDRNPGYAYKGSRNSKAFALQEAWLEDIRNCALWIKNLSLSCSVSDIFSKITVGAVSVLHIYGKNNEHSGQAAKLVFMKPESAAAFMTQCNTGEGIFIGGKKVVSRYNRDGCHRHPQPSHSRVLHIQGPNEIMNFEFWDVYFNIYCVFEIDGYKTILESERESRRTMEFRFARIDGQAQTCMQAILSDPKLAEDVHVYYAHDPCDPQS
jgi:hypothetical protein